MRTAIENSSDLELPAPIDRPSQRARYGISAGGIGPVGNNAMCDDLFAPPMADTKLTAAVAIIATIITRIR